MGGQRTDCFLAAERTLGFRNDRPCGRINKDTPVARIRVSDQETIRGQGRVRRRAGYHASWASGALPLGSNLVEKPRWNALDVRSQPKGLAILQGRRDKQIGPSIVPRPLAAFVRSAGEGALDINGMPYRRTWNPPNVLGPL